MFKISTETTTDKVQSSTKVRHVLSGLISVAKAASILGVNSVTVTRWCETGKLPAMAKPFGKKTTYKVPLKAVELLLQEQESQHVEKESSIVKEHSKYFAPWLEAMAKGGIKGKVYSPLSIADYKRHMECYLNRHKTLTVQCAQQELMKCPVEQYGKRVKYHKALVCFAKYLMSQGQISNTLLDELKGMRPKENPRPKRATVTENDLQLILNACETSNDRLLVLLLASTGVRAAEAASIQWGNINLQEGILHIPKGKGGKERKLGISPSLIELINEEANRRAKTYPAMALLLDSQEEPMDRYAIYRQLKQIGKKAGVEVHPHALRRAFVTINANKGRPLVILQRSCGHSSIKTTMKYCQTTEQEVIEAMKGWD